MNSLLSIGLSWLLGLLAFGDNVDDQLPPRPSGLGVRHIEACQIRLKHSSGSADFVGRWTYRITVKADGAVDTVSRPDDHIKTAQFVELADFETCLRRWRFVKPGTYNVYLHGGTASSRWTITVWNGAESMDVIIPRTLE
jgi:hypothetical protein